MDINNFFAVFGSLFEFFIFNTMTLDLEFEKGNPYFGHLFGFLCGVVWGYFDKLFTLSYKRSNDQDTDVLIS